MESRAGQSNTIRQRYEITIVIEEIFLQNEGNTSNGTAGLKENIQ